MASKTDVIPRRADVKRRREAPSGAAAGRDASTDGGVGPGDLGTLIGAWRQCFRPRGSWDESETSGAADVSVAAACRRSAVDRTLGRRESREGRSAGLPAFRAKRIMRHASIETTDRRDTSVQLSDLGRELERIRMGPVRTTVRTSTAPDGVNRCERLRTSRHGRDNASRSEAVLLARLGDDSRGDASKRVKGLELRAEPSDEARSPAALRRRSRRVATPQAEQLDRLAKGPRRRSLPRP